MRQGRRNRRFFLLSGVVPTLIGLALLAAAGWTYHNDVVGYDAFAKRSVATTGVIGSTSVVGLGVGNSGTTQYDIYAMVNFTVNGRPESARIFLESCDSLCAANYRSGEKLPITYDSQDAAYAVVGSHTPPFAPVNAAEVVYGILGLLALAVGVANLVFGPGPTATPSFGLRRHSGR